MQIDDSVKGDNQVNIEGNIADDRSIKEEILYLIASFKETAQKEISYYQIRTKYSLSIIAKGLAACLLALFFILIAFITLGLGLILILESVIGIIFATVVSVLIFLSLSLFMILIGRYYFRKLSFPELSDDKANYEERIEPDE